MADPRTAQLVRMLHYQARIGNDELRRILEKAEDWDLDELLTQLTRLGAIDEEWAQRARLSLEQKSRRQRDSLETFQIDRSFGNLALMRGWITVSQLEEGMLEQQRMHRMKLYFRMGEILLHMGHLEIPQVREILVEQGHGLRGCESCASLVRLVAGAKPSDEPCPECQGKLTDPIYLDLVRAD